MHAPVGSNTWPIRSGAQRSERNSLSSASITPAAPQLPDARKRRRPWWMQHQVRTRRVSHARTVAATINNSAKSLLRTTGKTKL